MISAEATIIDATGNQKIISRQFKSHKAAEVWVWSFSSNERCVHAGCPTLAFAKLIEDKKEDDTESIEN